MLALASFMAPSIVAPGAPARGEIADHCTHTEGEGYSLIGVFPDDLVDGFGARDDLFAAAANQLLAPVQGGGEPLSSLSDFISGDISGGRHQGARIFSEAAHVVFNCLSVFVHSVLFFRFCGSRLPLLY